MQDKLSALAFKFGHCAWLRLLLRVSRQGFSWFRLLQRGFIALFRFLRRCFYGKACNCFLAGLILLRVLRLQLAYFAQPFRHAFLTFRAWFRGLGGQQVFSAGVFPDAGNPVGELLVHAPLVFFSAGSFHCVYFSRELASGIFFLQSAFADTRQPLRRLLILAFGSYRLCLLRGGRLRGLPDGNNRPGLFSLAVVLLPESLKQVRNRDILLFWQPCVRISPLNPEKVFQIFAAVNAARGYWQVFFSTVRTEDHFRAHLFTPALFQAKHHPQTRHQRANAYANQQSARANQRQTLQIRDDGG